MSVAEVESMQDRRERKRLARLKAREEGGEEEPPAPADPPAPVEAEAREVEAEVEEPAATPASGKRAPPSAPLREMQNKEDLSLKEYLESLGESTALKISLIRTRPEMFRGKKVGGLLGTHRQYIDEEYIKEHHGGGTYTLRVMKANPRGSFVYAGQRTVDIAGDPRIDDLSMAEEGGPATRQPTAAEVVATQAAATAKAEAPLLARAFDLLADRGSDRKGSGMDPVALEAAVAPYRLMAEQAQRDMTALRAEMREMRGKPAEADSFKDKMLGAMIDNESARMTALRTQHESELRQLKESHREDEKRWEARSERDRSELRQQYDREREAMKQGHEIQISTLKHAHDMQKTLHEHEIKRLERDLSEMRGELKELRGRKEQSLLDKAKELKAVKDAIGDGDDKEEKSTAAQILGAVMESPLVGRVVDKVTTMATQSEPAAAQQQMPPLGMPFQGPDGKTYVRTPPHGHVREIRQGLPAQAQRRAPRARAAPPPTAEAPAGTNLASELGLSPIEVQAAVGYLEGAWNSQQEPAVVAQSVRSMIPEPILRVLRERGVDAFLDQVAQLDSASPLAQQGGRSYVRKVAKVLLDGGADE